MPTFQICPVTLCFCLYHNLQIALPFVLQKIYMQSLTNVFSIAQAVRCNIFSFKKAKKKKSKENKKKEMHKISL